jgi:N4-gp56 family major capsid protein
MPIPSTINYTDTVALANLVQTAYDRYVRLALRATPQFRAVADTKPVQQTAPGSSIVFNIHQDLAPRTAPLDEVADEDGVSLGNTTNITVTLREYGNYAVATKALKEFALDSNLDGNIANIVAYNLANSVDKIVESVLATGTQVIRESAGNLSTTAAVTTITATDTIKARDIRYAVAKLRAAAVPTFDGVNYVAYIHPEVAVDLRTETGALGWREPQNYGAGDGLTGIFAGEIGTFEGVRFIETPRTSNSQRGAGSNSAQVRVFNTYVLGREALAEAVAEEFHVVADGVIVDPLKRKMALGWYGIAGWSLFRPTALWRIETASSIHPAE